MSEKEVECFSVRIAVDEERAEEYRGVPGCTTTKCWVLIHRCCHVHGCQVVGFVATDYAPCSLPEAETFQIFNLSIVVQDYIRHTVVSGDNPSNEIVGSEHSVNTLFFVRER